MKKTKAFSYLRFSTPEQQRGDSYRRQTETAERYAAENGLELDDRSFQDLGVSAFRGGNVQDGMLGEFIRLAEEGVVPPGSCLIVESLDRLSRLKPRKALQLFERICEAGVKIVTLSDRRVYDIASLDSDPWSLMGALMVAVRAHEESAMKAGRLREVWKAKRRKALPVMTRRAPAWVATLEDNSGFRLIEDRAAIVRRIFAMTAAGVGQHEIAATLNREGVPCFGSAAFWHRSYVCKILKNEAAIGRFTPHVVDYSAGKKRRLPTEPRDGYFPAVVDAELFRSVQAQRMGSRATKTGSALRNIVAGLARCPHCHGTMTRVMKGAKGGSPYLVCARAKAKAGCTYHAVRLHRVEKALVDGIGVLVRDVPSKRSVLSDELEALHGQLSDIAASIQRIEAEASGSVSTSPIVAARLRAFRGLHDQLEAERLTLERQLEVAAGPALVPRMKKLVAEMRKSEIDRAATNALMRQLFEAVAVVDDMGVLAVRWLHGGESLIDLPPLSKPKREAAPIRR